MTRLPLLDPEHWDRFPDAAQALEDPNGLLAFGGDLSPRRLLAAYSQGIFPWFGEREPILWWSPDPRCVFHTHTPRINRSLQRLLKKKYWRLTVDHDFEQVIRSCALPRDNHSGSWLLPSMIDAYVQLHHLGHAHSVEVWDDQRLVGGIYGVAIGRLFCGESMFSAESGGSKLALVGLARLLQELEFPLLDTQVTNHHTVGLGAVEMPRAQFLQHVASLGRLPGIIGNWRHLTPRLIQPCAGNTPGF